MTSKTGKELECETRLAVAKLADNTAIQLAVGRASVANLWSGAACWVSFWGMLAVLGWAISS